MFHTYSYQCLCLYASQPPTGQERKIHPAALRKLAEERLGDSHDAGRALGFGTTGVRWPKKGAESQGLESPSKIGDIISTKYWVNFQNWGFLGHHQNKYLVEMISPRVG